MSARILQFHGTEADSEAPPITIGMPRSYGDDRRRAPSPQPFFIDDVAPEPLTDDERDLRASDWPTTRRYPRTLAGVDSAYPRSAAYGDAFDRFSDSFIEQDRQAAALSHKWAFRCMCAIGAVFLILYFAGAFQ